MIMYPARGSSGSSMDVKFRKFLFDKLLTDLVLELSSAESMRLRSRTDLHKHTRANACAAAMLRTRTPKQETSEL